MSLYCVKCRERTETNHTTTITTKNNRLALTGTCQICNTKKFKFIKKDSDVNTLKKKEEVISQPNWQNSLGLHGQNIPEKNTSQDIVTVDQEHD
jgi:hypothetical protein